MDNQLQLTAQNMPVCRDDSTEKSIRIPYDQEQDPWQRLTKVTTNPDLLPHFQNCEFIMLSDHVLIVKVKDINTLHWIRDHCRYILKELLVKITGDPELKIRLIGAANG